MSQDTNKDRIATVITSALRQLLNNHETPIHHDTKILDELGVDSTSVLQLLLHLEDELDIEFDPDTLLPKHFETIDSLSCYALGQIRNDPTEKSAPPNGQAHH